MTAVNLNRAVRGPVTAVPVVAGKGVRIVPDTVNNRFVAEADETVLWEGNDTGSSSFSLSEPMTNFEMCRFKIKTDQGYQYVFSNKGIEVNLVLMFPHGVTNAWTTWLLLDYATSTNTITVTHSKSISHSFSSSSTSLGSSVDNQKSCIVEVVGINRISST